MLSYLRPVFGGPGRRERRPDQHADLEPGRVAGRLAGRGERRGAGRLRHWPKARARRGARQVSGVGYTTVHDEEEGLRDPRGWGGERDTLAYGGKTLGHGGPD